VRHESLCSGTTRKGRPCLKIGHRLGNDGLRWCGSHSPPPGEYVRQPFPCGGFDVTGLPCLSAADVVAVHKGDEVALCRFHVGVVDEFGVIRTPSGYGKVKRAERDEADRPVDDRADDVVDDTNGAVLGEPAESIMKRIHARLSGLGAPTTEAIERVITEGLKARRWVTFSCMHCGKRNRVNTADIPTQLATIKVANDLAAPSETAGAGGDGSWAFDPDFDPHDPDVPTRVLISAAFPDREAWILRHHRDGNLGTRITEVLETHRRDAAGMWVREDELERARSDLIGMQQLCELLKPTLGISFTGSSVTTP
jgi:hypothetical protein